MSVLIPSSLSRVHSTFIIKTIFNFERQPRVFVYNLCVPSPSSTRNTTFIIPKTTLNGDSILYSVFRQRELTLRNYASYSRLTFGRNQIFVPRWQKIIVTNGGHICTIRSRVRACVYRAGGGGRGGEEGWKKRRKKKKIKILIHRKPHILPFGICCIWFLPDAYRSDVLIK